MARGCQSGPGGSHPSSAAGEHLVKRPAKPVKLTWSPIKCSTEGGTDIDAPFSSFDK